MSNPEHKKIIAQQTLKPYVPGGIEFVEVVVNRGRLPKAERTLTRRERSELEKNALQSSIMEPDVAIALSESTQQLDSTVLLPDESVLKTETNGGERFV